MARIKVKNLEKFSLSLQTKLKIEINKIFSNKRILNKVREIVKQNFLSKDFGSAKDPYKSRRDILAQYNTTAKEYNPDRLKAIFTGALLKDLIKGTVGFPTENRFEIGATENSTKGYKKKKGRTKPVKFEDIQDGLIDKLGYNYLELSEDSQTKIVNLIKDELDSIIKKLNR